MKRGKRDDESDGVSQSGSVASSTASSKAGESAMVVNTSFFILRIPVIPLLLHIDRQYPARLSSLGTLVDALQLVAFVVNPHVAYGSTLAAVTNIIYSVHFPIWDSQHANIGYYPAVGLAFVYILGLVATLGWCLSRLLDNSTVQVGWASEAMQGMLHAIGTWLAIPVVSTLMAVTVCGRGSFWALDEACSMSNAFHVLHRVIAAIAFALVFGLSYTVYTVLYDTDCFSTHPRARAHSRLDKVVVVFKFASVVLFHVANSEGKNHWFNLYFSISSCLVAALHAFFLPFFNQETNKMYTGLYMAVSWIALVAFLSHQGGVFTAMEFDFVLLGCGVLPACILGNRLANIRISENFELWEVFFRSGAVHRTPALEPKGLPPRSLYAKYEPSKDLEMQGAALDIYEGLPDPDISCTEAEVRADRAFRVPFVGRLWVATDCELATRNCVIYQSWTNRPANAIMVEHSSRFFCKALVTFKWSDILRMQLAQFTCWHTKETKAKNFTLHMHLEQCIARSETSLAVRYHASKLKQFIKVEIGMKDNSHIKVWRAAQKLHREVLNQMSNFWGKLLSSQVDTVQLAVITNAITHKRQHADLEFRRVLDVTKDEKVILSYALFLEQVMHDEEGAALIREQTAQSSEYRRTKVDVVSDHASFSNSLHQAQLTKLRYTLICMSILLALYLGGQTAYQVLSAEGREVSLNGLHHTGATRALTQQAAYRALSACVAVQECRSFVFQDNFMTATSFDRSGIVKELTHVDRITADMQAFHEDITVGSTKSSYRPLIDYMEQHSYAVVNHHRVTSTSETADYESFGLFNIGYEFVSVMQKLGTNGSAIEQLFAYKWIDANTEVAVVEMYSHALLLRLDEATEMVEHHLLITTVLFGVGILVLLCIYVLLITNFEEIDQAKLEALNLFTLIPKQELGKLHRLTKSKLALLDQKSDQYQAEEAAAVVASLKESESDGSSEEEDRYVPPASADNNDLDSEQYVFAEEEEGVDLDTSSKLFLGGMMFVTLVIVGVAAFTTTTTDSSWEAYRRELDSMLILADFVDKHLAIQDEALGFAVLGEPMYLVHYVDSLLGLDEVEFNRRLLELRLAPELLNLFQDIVVTSKRLRKNELIALKLASSVYGTNPSLQKALHDVEWRISESYRVELNPYARSLNMTQADLGLGDQEKIHIISEMLLQPGLDKVLTKQVYDFQEKVILLQERNQDNLTELCAFIVTVLSAVAVMTLLLIFASTLRSPALYKKTTLIASLLACLGAAVFVLYISLALIEATEEAEVVAHQRLLAYHTEEDARHTVRDLVRSCRAFIFTNDYHHYSDYWYGAQSGKLYNTMTSIHLEEGELTEIFELVDSLHRMSSIAMTLSAWSIGVDTAHMSDNGFANLDGLYWDFPLDKGYEEFQLRYPGYLWFTTTDQDALLPADRQKMIAKSVLGSHIYRELHGKLASKIHEVVHHHIPHKTLEVVGKDISDRAWETMIAACGLLASLVIYLLLLFWHCLEVNRQFSSNFGADVSSGNNLSLRGQICLGVLAVLFAGLYALQIVSLTRFDSDVRTLFHTSAREASIAQAQVMALRIAHGTPSSQWTERIRLKKKLDEMEGERANLYFGTDRTEGDLNRISKPEELFGELPDFQLPTCTPAASVAEAEALLSRGVDIAAQYWMHSAKALLAVPTSDIGQHLLRMLAAVDPVVYALEQSTAHYHEDAKAHNRDWNTYFLFLLGFTALVVFFQLLLVFRPMIAELLHQDTGTKIMLKMIPEDVRELVPVIQEYLDSGQVRDADPMEVINESINEMSTVPIIAIDHTGTVIRFTQGGEAVFGWQQSEVVGSNVRLLMPPEYARHHNAWLAAYLRTGVKKIIGTVRRVQGYRKDQTRFPMEVSVREHKKPGEDPVFISTVQDLTKTFELEAARKLNAAMQHMSSVPMLCIDTLASITVFNRAAEQCFGFMADEAVGQNVNILMPEEFAKHHDGYLASYIKTGVKKVIDVDRTAVALRKNGQVFPVVLSIKEVKLKEFGSSSLFLGFVRDRTADLIVEYEHLVHTTISNLNPLPIVSIDERGAILSFSDHASDLFGHKPDDVVGKNVKMLMPQEIAVQHDGYLSTYLATGKRSVIDTTRILTAKHADGYELPISLEAKEVNLVTGERVYVAFMRNLTSENKMKLIQEVQTRIVDESLIPIIQISEMGIVMTYNNAAASVFKHSRQEVVGHNIKILLPPAIALKHDSYLERYRTTKEKHVIGKQVVSTAKRSDGSTFLIRLKVDEIYSKLTDTTHYLGYLHDIEEEKVLEWVLLLNQQISDASVIPIISIDQVGTILTFSKAGGKVWGWDTQEVVGKNVKLLMNDETARVHDSYLSKYLRSGIKAVIDTHRVIEAKRKDGSPFIMSLSVKEVKQNGTRIYVGYCQDLTESERIERDRSLAETIFLQSPDPIIKIDSFGAILSVNTALTRLARYSEAELVGQNIKMLMQEKIAVRHDEILAAYRKTGHRTVIGRSIRNIVVTKDKKDVQVELKVEEIILDEMEPVFVGFLRDITELVSREEEGRVSDTLASLCTVGQVAIDNKGVILRFNKTSEQCWGISAKDAIGRNVSMLMMPEIAEKHDGYLRQYRKLGVKKVVDQKTLSKGMRTNGTTFDVELHVKEVVTNGTSLFLGYVRDCTEEIRNITNKMVGESIIRRSVEPVVIINPMGIVQVFNLAAQVLWGYTEDEVVGQNVKMLLPDDIAVKHDSYLELYRRTRTKKILDTTRILHAKTKSGVVVPAEVSAKAVGKHNREVYVAYVRPIAAKLEREAKVKLFETALSLSESPCISISQVGTVELWKNAESLFGWSEQEMLGQNIKVVMLPETAVQHDGYLTRYRMTKVKTIIDATKRVKAQSKAGAVIPLDISVREAVISPDESIYVANFQDATVMFGDELNVKVASTIRDMSDSPLVTINTEGSILLWNPAAHNTFGYTSEEAIGKNIKMMMPPEIAKNHDGYLERYNRTKVKHVIGSSKEVVGLKRTQNGHARVPLQLYLREAVSDGSSVFIGFIKDLSVEKATESGAKLNNFILNNSPLAFCSINAGGIIQQFNPAACKVFGYTLREVVGKNVKVLMPREIADNHDGYLKAYAESGVRHVVGSVQLLRAVKKDESNIIIETHIKEVEVQGVRLFMGYIRDSTPEVGRLNDNKIAEACQDLVSVGIVVIDVSGVIIMSNQSTASLFGYSQAHLVGKNVSLLMPEETAVNHDSYLCRYLAGGEKRVVDHVRVVMAKKEDGEVFPVQLRVFESLTDQHHYFVGYIDDQRKHTQMKISSALATLIPKLSFSPLIVINEWGVIDTFNAAAEERFGFAQEHVKDKNIRILMPDEVSDKHDGFLRGFIKGGCDTGRSKVFSSQGQRITAETKSGDLFQTRLSVFHTVDEHGTHWFVGCLRD